MNEPEWGAEVGYQRHPTHPNSLAGNGMPVRGKTQPVQYNAAGNSWACHPRYVL